MNIRYRIRLFMPTLVKDKGRACLIALLINVSVETHVNLTHKKNSVDEHQPFQPKMISKLVSIE